MKFNYKARTLDGDTQTGTVEAPSLESAVETLQRYDLIVVDIEEETGGISLDQEISFISRVKTEDIVLFTRQLSVLFDAQVPLLEALEALAVQSRTVKFRTIINDIANEVDAGSSLSQALEAHPKQFSDFYVSVVRAGEASGRLQEVLEYLADHEERSYDLIRKVRGALIYPAFIIFSIVAVGAVMMIFVVPQITSIFEDTGADLPILTQIVIGISNFLIAWWWILLLLLIGGGVAAWRYVKTPAGRKLWDTALLEVPIFKELFKKIALTRFAENLSTLIKGGLPIIQALNITASVVGNVVYEEAIRTAAEEVRKGGDISASLKGNEYIPTLVTQMISVGEGTGKLDSILGKVASFYQRDVDNMVNNITALIQPMLILVLGIAAGLLVAAILLPIYNLSSSF